jgi:hypothetical protein
VSCMTRMWIEVCSAAGVGGDGSSGQLVLEFRGALPPALVAGRGKLQVPPLRSPGFPVEVGGVGEIHAAFLTESRTRGC